MELSAKGMQVLITAGGGGIGRVMVETFVKAGARVHTCDVVPALLEGAETGVAVRGRARCATSPTCARSTSCSRTSKQHLGGLDVLVNNAGIAGPTGKVEEISIEDWRRCIDIDLNGMFYCTRLAMPMLKAAGRRLDHQPLLRRRAPGLSLPHPVRRRQVGRGRLHQEPVHGGRHATTSASTPFSPAWSRASASTA